MKEDVIEGPRTSRRRPKITSRKKPEQQEKEEKVEETTQSEEVCKKFTTASFGLTKRQESIPEEPRTSRRLRTKASITSVKKQEKDEDGGTKEADQSEKVCHSCSTENAKIDIIVKEDVIEGPRTSRRRPKITSRKKPEQQEKEEKVEETTQSEEVCKKFTTASFGLTKRQESIPEEPRTSRRLRAKSALLQKKHKKQDDADETKQCERVGLSRKSIQQAILICIDRRLFLRNRGPRAAFALSLLPTLGKSAGKLTRPKSLKGYGEIHLPCVTGLTMLQENDFNERRTSRRRAKSAVTSKKNQEVEEKQEEAGTTEHAETVCAKFHFL